MRGVAHGAGMQPLGSASPVHRRFVREWERLRHDPVALRHAAGWRLVTGPLRDLDEIVQLTLPTAPGSERVLHALVARAAHDDLAARLLLQRLLPDLARLHRRRRWRSGQVVDFGDLLATGWLVIRTYNPARRPSRLAGSLLSDVEYREYRAASRRIGHGTPADPIGFDELVDEPRPDPTVELAALVNESAGSLDDGDRHLLARLVDGRRTVEIARELEVTPRTIRNRRDRLTDKLREVAVAA